VLHRLPPQPMFHFIYVDGAHSASSTLEDSLMAWWRLRPGGVLIWDDYSWKWDCRKRKRYLARPKIAIDAFLRIYDERFDLLPHRGWQVAIQRR
jgi:predicted O-methyltransferase YrrM